MTTSKLVGDELPETVAKDTIRSTLQDIGENLQNHRIDFDMAERFMSILNEWNTTGLYTERMPDVKGSIEKINEEIEVINESISELKTTLASISDSIDTLTTAVSAINDTIIKNKEEADAEIEKLKTDLSALETRVKALEPETTGDGE